MPVLPWLSVSDVGGTFEKCALMAKKALTAHDRGIIQKLTMGEQSGKRGFAGASTRQESAPADWAVPRPLWRFMLIPIRRILQGFRLQSTSAVM